MATSIKTPANPQGDEQRFTDPSQEHYDNEFENIAQNYNKQSPTSGSDIAALKAMEENAKGLDFEQAKKGGEGQYTSQDKNRVSPQDPGKTEGAEEPSLHRARKLIPEAPQSAIDREFGNIVLHEGFDHENKHGKKKKLLVALLGGASGTVLITGVIALIIFIVAPYQHVHFATVLRTVGFARFHHQMKQQWARVMFDAQVLSEQSRGTFPDQRAGLVYKLVGVNPERQIAELGRTGKLQWTMSEQSRLRGILPPQNTLVGVVVDGRAITLDSIAERNFGHGFDNLPRGQKMEVRRQFIDTFRVAAGDALALEPRSVRFAANRAMYQAIGIRLWKWADIRAYRDLTRQEARALYVQETLDKVDGGRHARSGLRAIDEPAQEQKREDLQASQEGRTPQKVRVALAHQLRRTTRASDTVLATTLSCLIYDFANSLREVQADREERARRMAADIFSAGDQIKHGEGMVAEAVGAANEGWNGADQSVIYKLVTGQDVTDTHLAQLANIPFLDIQDKFSDVMIKVSDVLFSGPIDAVPSLREYKHSAINEACNILLDEKVQWGIAGAEGVVSLISLGTTRAVSTAAREGVKLGLYFGAGLVFTHWLGSFIDDMVDRLANTDFTGTEQGHQLFNNGYVATTSLAQYSDNNVNYGRPVDPNEAHAAWQVSMNDIREQYRNAPISTRYFAVDNPFSLTGRLAAITPTNMATTTASSRQAISSIGALLTSPARLLGTVATSFLKQKTAYADVGHDIFLETSFGVDQWGWSLEEQERVDTDPNFMPDRLDEIVLPNLEEWNRRYGECYNNPEFVIQSQRPSHCTKEFLSAGHERYGDDALYWRYFMAASLAAEELTESVR